MGEDAWPVMETSVENKEEVIPFNLRGEPLKTPGSTTSAHSYHLSGISETERAGGIYLGEDKKDAEGSTAYDKLSGIYLGEDKGPSRKTSHEESNEGGILSQMYKTAERRRKIVTRERGHYDERSGVYLGDDSSSTTPTQDEGIQLPAPGGILERLLAESAIPNKDSKLAHRRNFSEGNFAGGSFRSEKIAPYERFEGKRRALSNVDRMVSSLQAVGEHPSGELLSPNDHGLTATHKHTSSTPSEAESNRMDGVLDRDGKYRRTVSETSTESFLKPESRSRSGSEVTDFSSPLSIHVRSGSNLSTTSMDSGDYLEMYISSRSRTSSTSETGGYLQQGSPTNQSLMSIASDDTSKTLDDKDRNSSGESLQGVLSFESPPSYYSTSSRLVRDAACSSSPVDSGNGKEERKPFPGAERFQNEIESRQRSTSLTEKRRIGSPSLGIIPETRSSSFSGSTDFTKVVSKSRSATDVELIHVPPMENLNDLHGSTKSLAEVKILSDKTIVFCAGGNTKTRALSVDSASGLRRDRLLANGSQLIYDESDTSAPRSRGSSFEKADFARRLGLKSGDLSRSKRTRSSSSGNSLTDGSSSRRIVNKNKLFGSNENFTVVSGDSRRNSCASPEAAPYTSSRDAFGYTALSTLRRQRSFNRDLESKVNAYGAARTG